MNRGSRVATVDLQPALVVAVLAWAAHAPAGSRIAFIADGSSIDNLYVMKADGSVEQRVTHNGAPLPRWVRNPARISFAGTGKDSGRVFLVGLDGSGLRMVAEVEGRNPV